MSQGNILHTLRSHFAVALAAALFAGAGHIQPAGATYAYTHSVGGSWVQAAYLTASNAEAGDSFGSSVAVDSDTIVVGAKWKDRSAASTGDADSTG